MVLFGNTKKRIYRRTQTNAVMLDVAKTYQIADPLVILLFRHEEIVRNVAATVHLENRASTNALKEKHLLSPSPSSSAAARARSSRRRVSGMKKKLRPSARSSRFRPGAVGARPPPRRGAGHGAGAGTTGGGGPPCHCRGECRVAGKRCPSVDAGRAPLPSRSWS